VRLAGPARAFAAAALCATVLSLTGCAAPRPAPDSDPVTPGDQSELDRRAQVRLELASAYFGRGQTDTALDELRHVLALTPNSAAAYNLRGLILASRGDNAPADESFRRALQLKPQDSDTLHNYGWFLCQQGQYAEALAQFRLALAQPRYAQPQRTLQVQGVCEARAGQWAEAERSLMRSYELDPGNPGTALNLAEVLYRRGDYERARFYVRRVNANPDQSTAQTLWLAARIERKRNNRSGVQDLGNELRNRFPEAPEALAFEQGRFDD
jgi:type IV pilus assembly protein PilF